MAHLSRPGWVDEMFDPSSGQVFSAKNHRIYLLGNPIIFWGLLVTKAVFILAFVIHNIKLKPGVKVMLPIVRYTCWYLLLGWALHYLPFRRMGRVLYFHHYFPAFSAMFGEAQQTINVTAVKSGTVDTAIATGIHHGDMNIIVNEQRKTHLERTKTEIEVMTAGMIQVSAVEDVVNKMNKGQHWITITGNAGDGKTTLGYLVLKKFLKENVKVFTIYKPEEYDQIADKEEDRVFLLDDRFGAFLADQQLIRSWLDVIKHFLRISQTDKLKTRVIFISRVNVLKGSKVYLGDLTDDIYNRDCVVDLSTRNETGERLKILEYHLGRENVTIDPDIKHRVCKMQIAHGFPYCCRMFSKLKSQANVGTIEEFFESPLKFLDFTTRNLYKKNCKDIFQLLIQNDGQIDINSIEDDKKRQDLREVEKEQEDSYITVWYNGLCRFAHPSVYESVLNVINEIDPKYCVKYATLTVIRQKMQMATSGDDNRRKSSCYIVVKRETEVLTTLANRFRIEILEGDYSVFRHRLCKDNDFCKALVSNCVNTTQEKNDSKQCINKPGKKGQTMLWTALRRGRMAAVQVLVKAGADVSIQDERGRAPLQYLCQLKTAAAPPADDIDGDDDDGDDANYPCIDMDTIRVIVNEGGGDINICDQFGKTPLHHLFTCRAMREEEIKWIITEGKGDLGKCEQNKTTPLHYLCAYSSLQRDSVDLVIREGKGDFNKGDEHGTTPLHYVCDNTHIEFDVVFRIFNTANGDINKQDDNRITTLHVICKGSHQIKDILPLIHQGDKADMYGNTPLHFLCRRRGINAEELQQQLKQFPETCMKKQNSVGYTPMDYLNDQDDSLPWRDGMIDRSPADLVMCRFVQGNKRIVVKAPAMTLSSERVHRFLHVEDFSQELTNMAWSGGRDRPGRFRWFEGTCSSPVPVPPSPSPFSLPTYWETHSRYTWREGVKCLLEMGVVEGEDHLDKWICVSDLLGSVCVSVKESCFRHCGLDCLCIQVRRRDQEYRGHQEYSGYKDMMEDRNKVCECVTLPLPTPGEEITFKFGLVLDVGRGRVGFIDVKRGEILAKVNRKFTDCVFPMFCVRPFPDRPTRMRLVSGREISRNDRKIKLIQKVLSH